ALLASLCRSLCSLTFISCCFLLLLFLHLFFFLFFLLLPHHPRSTLFPYTTLFRSCGSAPRSWIGSRRACLSHTCARSSSSSSGTATHSSPSRNRTPSGRSRPIPPRDRKSVV